MAVHVSRSHEIAVRAQVGEVFPMFTPAGEESWVDGWRPDYVYPGGRETSEGMIFRTSHGAEETLWSCVAWEPERHRVKYLRVTPGSRMGYVEVTCRSADDGATITKVRYDLTSLSEAGDHALHHLTPEHFRGMIEGWRREVEAALARA